MTTTMAQEKHKYEVSVTISVRIPLFINAEQDEVITPGVNRLLDGYINELSDVNCDFEDDPVFDISDICIVSKDGMYVDEELQKRQFAKEECDLSNEEFIDI